MKRLLFFSTLLLIVSSVLAQGVTVRFTAQSNNGQYHSFDSVRVENVSQGWSQRIAYPDTILTLGSSNSIDSKTISTVDLKVYPNPFAGYTRTNMQINEDSEVSISILRIDGSIVSEYKDFMTAGVYNLNISLAEPQVAFLSVSTQAGRSVAKMVNTQTGSSNHIEVLHQSNIKNTKAVGIGPFSIGDQMRYTGVSINGNNKTVSNSLIQAQTASGLVTLVFVESSALTVPVVSTSSVSNITSSSATCGGSVSYDGGQTVTARGVCWSTSHNPTTSSSHTTDGIGTGSFTSSMTGLSSNTTYYVRAYATNSVGTSYGEERSFTTSANITLPTVTTSTVSSITTTTATCGGNVTNAGNATVTARGVCWSTSHNPTTSSSHTTDGTGTGSFTSSITGLSSNITYYVRAYATNSVGTTYGDEIEFITSTEPFDQNGALNAVFTVAEGCTVKFSRGNLQYQASTDTWRFAEHQFDYVGSTNSNISPVNNGWIDLFSWGTAGWNSGANVYHPWEPSTNNSDYYPGGSYTNNLTGVFANADWGVYNAISNGGNQAGIWRALTKDEWSYLLNSRAASTINGEANARYAKAVVNGTNGVILFPDSFTMPSGISYPSGINTSSASFSSNTYTESLWSQMEGSGCVFLPAAGERTYTDVYAVGTNGYYWSSTNCGENGAYDVEFRDNALLVNGNSRNSGQSVRLVNTTTLVVSTSSVSNITSSSATCGGIVSYDGGQAATARGVCWSTSHNPTTSSSHTTDGTGTGSFTSSITGLSSNTTYYVRAYASNSAGTAYGSEVSFTTTNTPSIVVFDENGASTAVFTVASGRTVKFSRGNLQYQASSGIWRFAEHQYDFIGADNINISETYSGWIDLFGWGTSGWNSGALRYQPWTTYTSSSGYYPGGSYTNDLTGSYANADWGVYNAISNGGNQAGMWRTLTRYEWDYLLNSRAASTINITSNARYAKAVVNGVNGLVLFPDNFTMPSGMSYPSGINTSSASFNSNTYTESQWSQMECAGCIFLPAAGSRSGTSVNDVGTGGNYWSSTHYNDEYSWGMDFDIDDLVVYLNRRYLGQSVRLVRD